MFPDGDRYAVFNLFLMLTLLKYGSHLLRNGWIDSMMLILLAILVLTSGWFADFVRGAIWFLWIVSAIVVCASISTSYLYSLRPIEIVTETCDSITDSWFHERIVCSMRAELTKSENPALGIFKKLVAANLEAFVSFGDYLTTKLDTTEQQNTNGNRSEKNKEEQTIETTKREP